LLKANDPWFRGVSLLQGPDGGVFVSDWSDAGECHDYEDIHRENGRLFKLTHGTPKVERIDLAKLSDAELVRLQLHKNDWHVTQARLLLQERAAKGKLATETRSALQQILRQQTNVAVQLRALWALHVTGGLDEKLVTELLGHSQEWVRGWTVQLAVQASDGEPGSVSTAARHLAAEKLLTQLANLGTKEPSAVVRRYLASALQRFPIGQRPTLAEPLARHAEDAADPNIPLLLWYALEPIASNDDRGAIALFARAQIPVLRQFIAQRMALRMALDPLVSAMRQTGDAGVQRDGVLGMSEALNGRRGIPAPLEWGAITPALSRHADSQVREQALLLSLVFGREEAAAALRERAQDPRTAPEVRQRSLHALVQARVADLVPLLQASVAEPVLRRVSIRGLSAFDDAATPRSILSHYGRFAMEERAEAINTLASRPGYAIALLEAVKAGSVSARDISPFAARQIQALKDDRIPALLTATLGEIRPVSKGKAGLIARYKEKFAPTALKAASPRNGRVIFNRACSACHTLFGEGGTLAPELTGSQRSNLDYLLEHVVDPNAVVWKQYRATYFETADDRLISGVVRQENESTVTIQTQTGLVTLPRKDITSRKESELSMMPEGLLESLTDKESTDLIAYLQSPSQVPLPEPKN
jgi:putative heme-binding domain-containing protein